MLQRIRDTEAEPVEAASIVAQMRSIILIRLGESGCDGAEAVTMDPDVSDALDTYLDIAIDEGLRKAAPGPTVDITTHLTDAHTESLEAYSLESIEALDQKVQAAIKETREWGKKLAEDASAKAPSLSSAQLRQKERALRLAESQSAWHRNGYFFIWRFHNFLKNVKCKIKKYLVFVAAVYESPIFGW
jgi:hypothetical protein